MAASTAIPAASRAAPSEAGRPPGLPLEAGHARWTCALKNPPEKITVGDRLIISCEGETPVPLKGDLQIIFPKKEDAYRLRVLKTLHAEDSYADMEAAPYRTGSFQGSFIVTDGARGFTAEGFSLSVDSVLPEGAGQAKKPHGPFGPWKEPLPLWYAAGWIFAVSLGAILIFLILRRFFKRLRFIKKAKLRAGGRQPSKLFVKALRRSRPSLKNLENLFKDFLENLCLIPARNRSPEQIMSDLKKYRPELHKRHGPALQRIFNEFEAFRNSPPPAAAASQIERSCCRLAFQLEEGGESSSAGRGGL